MVRLVVEHARSPRSAAVVVDDAEVVELHGGLDDERDDPRPTRRARRRSRSAARCAASVARAASAGRRLEGVERLVGAAGNGHLGADDVDRRRDGVGRRSSRRRRAVAPRARRRPRPEAARGRRRRPCCSRGGSSRSRRRRRPRRGRRPSPSPVRRARRCQRFGPRWSPPRISRSRGKPSSSANVSTRSRKSAALHAGVAAELVDLVARGLDQQHRPVRDRLTMAARSTSGCAEHTEYTPLPSPARVASNDGFDLVHDVLSPHHRHGHGATWRHLRGAALTITWARMNAQFSRITDADSARR